MTETLSPAEERRKKAQAARRKQMLAQGYSSNCARAMHTECSGDTCICKCHRSERQTAPKRPEVGVPRPVLSAVKTRQVKSIFALGIWGADQVAARSAPQYWNTPEDRLTGDEQAALVGATYTEIEARFPKLLEWFAKASESATEAALVWTVAMIALPRLARHGVISNELATAILFAPFAVANATAPAGVESHGTPQPDRSNRNGQIDASGVPAPISEIRGSAAEQARQGDVPDAENHPDRGGNGRYAA